MESVNKKGLKTWQYIGLAIALVGLGVFIGRKWGIAKGKSALKLDGNKLVIGEGKEIHVIGPDSQFPYEFVKDGISYQVLQQKDEKGNLVGYTVNGQKVA